MEMLYFSLIYPILSYGIVAWGQNAKALATRIFILRKRAVRYTATLKHLESRNSRKLKILTVYLLSIYIYIQKTILYVKEK
jgi:hypothetical protein